MSEYTKDIFTSLIPSVKNKTLAIHNFIPSNRIIELSKNDIDLPTDDSVFIIVSIGRLDPVKRFNLIPSISRNLVNRGCVFQWFIIGGGSEDN